LDHDLATWALTPARRGRRRGRNIAVVDEVVR
jgi:hypothetical protein